MTDVILRKINDEEHISDYELASHLLEAIHNVNFKG